MSVFNRASAAALSLLAAGVLRADVTLPRPSPGATVSQMIGTAKVTVAYHRPAVKGRAIWGALVPYGETWRLGANDATTLELTHPAKVAGKDLAAGTYAVFAVPAKDRWTLVFNSDAKQWGAYFRDTKKDVLGIDVTPEAVPHHEFFEVRLLPEPPRVVKVEIAWEKLGVSFPIEFDVNGIVWRELEKAMAAAGEKAWVDDYQAARFARESGERKEKAMGWLDEAMKRGSSFWMDEMKGDLLAEQGKYAEAMPHLTKAIEASKAAGAPEAWRDGAKKKLAEWQAKAKG